MLTRIAPTLAVAYWVNDPLGAVRRPDAHPVALADAGAHQAAGEPVDLAHPARRTSSAGRWRGRRAPRGRAPGPPSRRGCRRWSARAGRACPSRPCATGRGRVSRVPSASFPAAVLDPPQPIPRRGREASALRETGCPVARPPTRCAQPGVGRDKRSRTPSSSASRSGGGQASSRALTGGHPARQRERAVARPRARRRRAARRSPRRRAWPGRSTPMKRRRARGRPRPDRPRARRPPTPRSADDELGAPTGRSPPTG